MSVLGRGPETRMFEGQKKIKRPEKDIGGDKKDKRMQSGKNRH